MAALLRNTPCPYSIREDPGSGGFYACCDAIVLMKVTYLTVSTRICAQLPPQVTRLLFDLTLYSWGTKDGGMGYNDPLDCHGRAEVESGSQGSAVCVRGLCPYRKAVTTLLRNTSCPC